jgi:hypothetical protein
LELFLKNRILFVTFNYEPWPLAATIEIITNEIKNGNEVTWIDLNNSFKKILLYPVSDTLKNVKIKNSIKKKFLNNKINYLNQASLTKNNYLVAQSKSQQYILNRAKEIAFAELISVLRDSAPCIKHNKKLLNNYERVYIDTFNAISSKVSVNLYDKVYIYNGRNLQERATWDACIKAGVRINFFESFNENWTNRYFIFEQPTHFPPYRSKIMLDYSKKEREKDSSYYHYVANKWFTDRQIGVSQKFTKLQNNFEVNIFRKPYIVFFHSSQDELDMIGLVSDYWKNQFNSLNLLIEILQKNPNFKLVLRIHPHLLHKSKREILYWDKIGKELEQKYLWFDYIPARSNVNSYELIRNAEAVISCASTIGVEAAYLKKKSILLGQAFHEYMGVTQNPKDVEELTKILFSESGPDEITQRFDASLAYGYFSEMGGNYFKHVSYSLKFGRRVYKYSDFLISSGIILRLIRRIEEVIIKNKSNLIQRRCANDCGLDTRPRRK